MDTERFFWKPNNVKSATDAKMTPLSVDVDAKSGVFPSSKGNNTYVCTLEYCPCVDYARNRKPCKHMIRLAHELHVITLDGVQSSADAAEEKRILSQIDEFTKYGSLESVITLYRIADALYKGEAVTDQQLELLRSCVPILINNRGKFNRKASSIYQSMRQKLNNRLGLLLVDHINELPEDFVELLCRFDRYYPNEVVVELTPDEFVAN